METLQPEPDPQRRPPRKANASDDDFSAEDIREIIKTAVPPLAEAWKVREVQATERMRIQSRSIHLPSMWCLGVLVFGILFLAGWALLLGKEQTMTTLIGYAVAVSGGFALGRRGKGE